VGNEEEELQLLLLFDQKERKVSFINNGGQILINISEEFYEYLLQKSNYEN
jgi:hypothetical protein